MVKQEVIVECIALCVASLLVMTSALGDVTFMHPIGARGGMLIHDIDTPDTAIISASPFGGNLISSVDLGDSFYHLGGGIAPAYQAPVFNAGLNVLPPYSTASRRRLGYPAGRRFGRARRMRLVPV